MVLIATRPGLMQRAGMAGAPCGLDYAAALALVPAGLDPDLVRTLLYAAEDGLLLAAADKSDKDSGHGR